jgi:hypothetical protein
VPITTDVMKSNLDQGEVYNDRSVVLSGSSTNKTDRHDIPEILLELALNTIKPNQSNGFHFPSLSDLITRQIPSKTVITGVNVVNTLLNNCI